MAQRLDTRDPAFAAAFDAFAAAKRAREADVDADVARILADVRARGDEAVAAYTARFDRVTLAPAAFRLTDDEIAATAARCPAKVRDALAFAARRVEAYHRRQRPEESAWRDEAGVRLGARWTALDAVGLYVPGGTAAYPSSVLMNALPARIAGVARVAMAAPTPGGALNPAVIAAARIAGVDEIYRIGGAQAIAAFAFGTETIAPVDKIVGPGNAYVAAAKRQVFGTVGIDTIAGPSEIVVVADGGNDPAWIAADLLSQAEHDEAAQAILFTDDAAFADAVAAAVERHLKTLDRAAVAAESWRANGAIIVVKTLDEAPALIDRIAPEHLEIATAEPDALAAKVRHAGAIFLGRYTPEAIGDYVAGPNHVLPTGGAARFASGLSTLDFMKRTSIVACDAASFAAIGPTAATLADAEGLGAHALSVRIRLDADGDAP